MRFQTRYELKNDRVLNTILKLDKFFEIDCTPFRYITKCTLEIDYELPSEIDYGHVPKRCQVNFLFTADHTWQEIGFAKAPL